MRTTIKDIAKKTQLSVATVSLVLNNKADNISSKTKELFIDFMLGRPAAVCSVAGSIFPLTLVHLQNKCIGCPAAKERAAGQPFC